MEGSAEGMNMLFSPPVHSATRVLHGFIAVTAFFSNLMLCIVLIKRRLEMLKKPYNILILNLAVTDMLTGIFVALGPRLVILRTSFPDLQGIWGDFFCRALLNYWFILVFGKASNLTIMCLSIERWFAFVRPIQYKVAFTKPRMVKYLVVIWSFVIVSTIYALFAQSAIDGRCVKNPILKPKNSRYNVIIHIVVTFGLPVTVTWGTFAHLWHKLKTSMVAGITNQGRARVRLLRMCALAALLLTLCWLPAECTILLIVCRVLDRNSYWGLATFMLGIFNSCVNPWVFYVSNQEYKRECVRVLCFWRKNQRIQPAVSSRVRMLQYCTPSRSVRKIEHHVEKT